MGRGGGVGASSARGGGVGASSARGGGVGAGSARGDGVNRVFTRSSAAGIVGPIEPTRGLAMIETARLSYSHGASPDPLLGETIGDNLRRIAAAHPGREVLVDVPSGRRWTYARFDADTDTLARGLIAQGIEAGDRVGIWSPNGPEWVLLQYATAKAGVVLVNINPAYRGHEVGY